MGFISLSPASLEPAEIAEKDFFLLSLRGRQKKNTQLHMDKIHHVVHITVSLSRLLHYKSYRVRPQGWGFMIFPLSGKIIKRIFSVLSASLAKRAVNL
jgi:hypothetical protein